MNHRQHDCPRNERPTHEKHLDARALPPPEVELWMRELLPKAFASRTSLKLLRHNVLASLAIPPLRCANGLGRFASEIAPWMMQAQMRNHAEVAMMIAHSIVVRVR
jgi:hypothetical protein